MSDVMKAIQRVEAARKQLDEAETLPYKMELLVDVNWITKENYPILRDHIGELHKGIAEFEATFGEPQWLPPEFVEAAAKLIALLPTDWAGEGQ